MNTEQKQNNTPSANKKEEFGEREGGQNKDITSQKNKKEARRGPGQVKHKKADKAGLFKDNTNKQQNDTDKTNRVKGETVVLSKNHNKVISYKQYDINNSMLKHSKQEQAYHNESTTQTGQCINYDLNKNSFNIIRAWPPPTPTGQGENEGEYEGNMKQEGGQNRDITPTKKQKRDQARAGAEKAQKTKKAGLFKDDMNKQQNNTDETSRTKKKTVILLKKQQQTDIL